MKKRFTEQQIVAILKEGEAGVAVKEICRKHNIADATFYTWRKKYCSATIKMRGRVASFKNAPELADRCLTKMLLLRS